MSTKKIPKHIYWSARDDLELDLDDPNQRRWWIKRVLTNGTMADVCALDLKEVEAALPQLYLPKPVQSLWMDYFARRNSEPLPPEGS